MTHEVTNQVPPLEDRNIFQLDPLLVELDLSPGRMDNLRRLGQDLGSAETRKLGFLANENPPQLKTHDRYGRRQDFVEFHPSYHQLMSKGTEFGVHSLPWEPGQAGIESCLERACGHYLMNQVESSVLCPLTMTFAGVPALAAAPQWLQDEWLPLLTSRRYDSRFVPASEKNGATMGMAMTEKQGGSDVRANTTLATSVDGEIYTLRGHKWFCSAPMSDAFLTLAHTDNGLTCFFVPRFKPDGKLNEIRVMRLKNKLGNKANASSEIEYENAWAVRVGPEGRGVPTIIEMVNHTRLDCVVGSAGIMRGALVEALHHTCHRSTFGRLLRDQPLMQNVLADLCLEWEASWRMVVRLCQAYGRAADDPRERLFARFATAVAKFWVCKRTSMMVVECLECLGGNGYCEDFIQARHYREAPLASVWEGSGNVISLDLLRALQKEPDAVRVFIDEVSESPYVTRQTLEALLVQETTPFHARRLAQHLALHWQAQLMEHSSTPNAGKIFYQSRLEKGSSVFGIQGDQKASLELLDRFLQPLLDLSESPQFAAR